METETYEALQPFLHDNVSLETGAQIKMTPAQAAYLLAGEFIRPTAVKAAKPKPAEKGTKA